MTTRREAMGLLTGAGVAAILPSTAFANGTIPAGEGEGWQPLLNGQDLAGWTFFQDGVGSQDRDGVIGLHAGVMHVPGPEYSSVNIRAL